MKANSRSGDRQLEPGEHERPPRCAGQSGDRADQEAAGHAGHHADGGSIKKPEQAERHADAGPVLDRQSPGRATIGKVGRPRVGGDG
jgi:hypothetical protein